MALIILRQTLVMVLYMLAGFVLFKTGKITARGSKEIASLLLWLIIPAVLINSFCTEFSSEKLMELLQSSLLGALSLLCSILIARLIFAKSPVDNFAAAFSNAGFIGIPLVTAAVGSHAVFWLVGLISMLNLLQWTYGVNVLTGRKTEMNLKALLVNPIIAGTLIGLVLFLSGIGASLPSVVSTTMNGIVSLNAPLAMLVLGTYLAQSDLKAMIVNKKLYVTCFVRLILIPAVTLILFSLLQLSADMRMTLFIAAGAPIGANVAVYSQLHDLDYPYACQTVAMSTLLSILTLPFMMIAAGILIH